MRVRAAAGRRHVWPALTDSRGFAAATRLAPAAQLITAEWAVLGSNHQRGFIARFADAVTELKFGKCRLLRTSIPMNRTD